MSQKINILSTYKANNHELKSISEKVILEVMKQVKDNNQVMSEKQKEQIFAIYS